MRGRELISLPVINLETREVLGEVKDLIYDPSGSKLIALVVEGGGWWRGARVINFEQVAHIKQEGVYIPQAAAIIDTNDTDETRKLWQDKQCIFGHKFVNTDGEEMGTIEDILVDHETGNLVGYEISNGVIEDLLSGRVNVDIPDNFIIETDCVKCLGDDQSSG